jgi:succinate dehydrogenase flavin-adding protein (antitoxin of CptAB toxin-antitoxin module)
MSTVDINEFGKWAFREHGIKLKVPDAKYVEWLLGQGECPKWTREKKKPMLRKLLREYRELKVEE